MITPDSCPKVKRYVTKRISPYHVEGIQAHICTDGFGLEGIIEAVCVQRRQRLPKLARLCTDQVFQRFRHGIGSAKAGIPRVKVLLTYGGKIVIEV